MEIGRSGITLIDGADADGFTLAPVNLFHRGCNFESYLRANHSTGVQYFRLLSSIQEEACPLTNHRGLL